MSCNLRLCFHNTTARLRTIRIEPWARHFLLGPDEKLEIIARTIRENASFRIVEANDATLIYTERCDNSMSFRTTLRMISCGTTKSRWNPSAHAHRVIIRCSIRISTCTNTIRAGPDRIIFGQCKSNGRFRYCLGFPV